MNLWHDIPLGDNAPNEINTIIEIPRGSSNKYEIDKQTGLIKLDRANYSAAPYPFDYGFAPQTLWDDGDALDVMVLSTYPLFPGVLVAVRPIGIMDMIDSGESDYNVIGVPIADRNWEHIQDISELSPHSLREFQHFFETYKMLKGKPVSVEIKGFKGKEEARKAIERSVILYKEKFSK